MEKLKITLMKSTIGTLAKQKATVAALGLKKVGDTVLHADNVNTKGMLKVVAHMVNVETVTVADAPKAEKPKAEKPVAPKAEKPVAPKAEKLEKPKAIGDSALSNMKAISHDKVVFETKPVAPKADAPKAKPAKASAKSE